MPTTSNFGWTTPADTDLVKDGAAAIRTLANGIDTSFLDLKGGTTGQVLSKTSNSDLDFTWVAQDDSNAIQNALLTTTGDTIYASAASTPARLAVGSSGQVLTVSGGVPTWATPVLGRTAANYSLISSATLTGAATITISGITNQENLFITFFGSSATAQSYFRLRINGETSNYYDTSSLKSTAGSTYTSANALSNNYGSGTYIELGRMANHVDSEISGYVTLAGCNVTDGYMPYTYAASGNASGSDTQEANWGGGVFSRRNAKVTSISLISSAGNFDSGTLYVYGSGN